MTPTNYEQALKGALTALLQSIEFGIDNCRITLKNVAELRKTAPSAEYPYFECLLRKLTEELAERLENERETLKELNKCRETT